MFEGRTAKSISEEDLHDLVSRGVHEDETIDFKSDAYHLSVKSNAEFDKRVDLWIDISALANANEGWIICGIKDVDGVASDVTGVNLLYNLEQTRNDLDRAISEGIRPYPLSIEFNIINLQSASKHPFALIIRVPPSYNRPHQIKFKDKYVFQIRRSNGNDNMTIDELRTQFTLAATAREQMRAFRKQRVEAVSGPNDEETPVLIETAPHLILHIIPVTFYETAIDLSVLDPMSTLGFRRPVFTMDIIMPMVI